MEGYLGETPIRVEKTPTEWALELIARDGGTDGDHHKAWVLDQIARVLTGTPVHVVEARWSNGHTEVRFDTGEPSEAYRAFVARVRDGEDGPETYSYGVAP